MKSHFENNTRNKKIILNRDRKSENGKRFLVTVTITAVIIIIISFFKSYEAHPERWLSQCKDNRSAIIRYANIHYPDATIVKECYPSANFNPTNNPADYIVFELNGVQFPIYSQMGEVTPEVDDLYGASLLCQEIREKYLNNFNNRYNLSIIPQISFGEYNPKPNDTLDSYNGHIFLNFVLPYEQEKNSPRDLGWLYDFYCYWDTSFLKKDYTIKFRYIIPNGQTFELEYSCKSVFKDEDNFYSSFLYYENK